ncbi:MAG: hypothetical protein IJ156_03200 [Bacteroidales bacterium]|nr:hypothetical protein [Bacteroidales bacterium]
MNSAFRKALLLLLPLAATACVKTSSEIGKDLIDLSLLYDTYTIEIPVEDIRLRRADDLSGFSDSRIAIGAIREETFGLTTRSSAFSLVPALDTIDLGTNPEFVKFQVHFEADTVSVATPGNERILQNLYVYALTDSLSSKRSGTNLPVPHGTEIVSRGIPVYDGKDSLSFELSPEYGQKYIDVLKRIGPVLMDRSAESSTNKYKEYIEAVPGIYIESDVPDGIGGRINLFNLSVLSVSNNYYYRNDNVATLTIRSTYGSERKDTSFLFIPGEPVFYNEKDYLSSNKQFYQYAFNHTTHEKPEGAAVDHVYIEGGGGLKPVFPMAPLVEKVKDAILERGGNPSKTIINKATLFLPYELPEDPFQVDYFPSMLSPTIRMVTDEKEGTVSFAGLTDASASSENQGDLDRANLRYAPDITYHFQEILLRDDLETDDDADVWLLTVHSETTANATGNAEQEAYYRQMMYAMYYNNLYGGYGGYGGYGSYGYGGYGGYGGYSNYYNYMMMAQMYASMNQTTYSTTQELDKDRFYRAVLNGPASTAKDAYTGAKRVPALRVTFSVPKG